MKLTSVPHKEHCFWAGYDFNVGGTSSDLRIEDSTALCRICSIFSTCLLADSCCFWAIFFCNSSWFANCAAWSADKRSSLSLAFSLANSYKLFPI